jgi:hypothetical protein
MGIPFESNPVHDIQCRICTPCVYRHPKACHTSRPLGTRGPSEASKFHVQSNRWDRACVRKPFRRSSQSIDILPTFDRKVPCWSIPCEDGHCSLPLSSPSSMPRPGDKSSGNNRAPSTPGRHWDGCNTCICLAKDDGERRLKQRKNDAKQVTENPPHH